MKTEELGRSLLASYARVPDPRSRHGRRHPLPAILALATAAMLSGAKSLYAIAQWGRLQSAETVAALGFSRPRTPSVSTLHEVFKLVDVTVLEEELGHWAQQAGGAATTAQIALDGKTLRGSQGRAPTGGVIVVAAYGQPAGQVLAQSGGGGR